MIHKDFGITLVLVLAGITCLAAGKYKPVSMEGYTIQRCYECDSAAPEYEEIVEIYHVDDRLIELTFLVTGEAHMNDSLTFSIAQDSLIFDYNFTDFTVTFEEPKERVWFKIKIVVENFEIPNRYKLIADGLEVFISNEIYADYMTSYKEIDGEFLNVRDYHGHKQGRWVLHNMYGIVCDMIYENDLPLNGFYWREYFPWGFYQNTVIDGIEEITFMVEKDYWNSPYSVSLDK